jgi:hypothetical protein
MSIFQIFLCVCVERQKSQPIDALYQCSSPLSVMSLAVSLAVLSDFPQSMHAKVGRCFRLHIYTAASFTPFHVIIYSYSCYTRCVADSVAKQTHIHTKCGYCTTRDIGRWSWMLTSSGFGTQPSQPLPGYEVRICLHWMRKIPLCYQRARNWAHIQSRYLTSVIFQEIHVCIHSKGDRSLRSLLTPSHIKQCSQYKNITSSATENDSLWLAFFVLNVNFLHSTCERMFI